MERLIEWLSQRKVFTTALASIYLVVVVFFHKEVSEFSDRLSAKLSFKTYNDLIYLVSLMIVVVFGVFVLTRIIRGEQRVLKIGCWVFTAFLVAISYKTLIVFNVELIHFPQYTLLALPVFALFKHFGKTVFWVTLAGVFDEAHQYFVLHPETYLDFNDIVLNLIGAGIGIGLIHTLTDLNSEPSVFRAGSSGKASTTLTIAGCILFGMISLYVAGILRFYPDPNAPNAPIVLSAQPAPTQFWTTLTRGKPYHQFHPIEGTLFSALLIACYSLMDYSLKSKKKP